MWLARDSIIRIQSCFIIWPNTNNLFGSLFGTKANTKQIFSTALLEITLWCNAILEVSG